MTRDYEDLRTPADHLLQQLCSAAVTARDCYPSAYPVLEALCSDIEAGRPVELATPPPASPAPKQTDRWAASLLADALALLIDLRATEEERQFGGPHEEDFRAILDRLPAILDRLPGDIRDNLAALTAGVPADPGF